ncbi:DUF2970 domain-containing protein [Nitrosovibrio sp. Nv17]|uniref:DUF2970 domain-containing protein n=1 Tax=Nitrosovibrio sp. Nv17 TaxID=1855339 RepID=UPI000908B0A5|nr:DUF2970 domain-containing protein [Nitrosovibrio sp. Nv17]SFW33290.1 Protein of unknown function [Nitrosovibrio sp. Nv17]
MSSDQSKNSEKTERGTFLQAMKAVTWAFFGVRKHTDHDHDAATLTVGQVIAAGLLGATLFIAGVLLLVKFVTS